MDNQIPKINYGVIKNKSFSALDKLYTEQFAEELRRYRDEWLVTPTHVITISKEKHMNTYCLPVKKEDKVEIILSKCIKDTVKFEEEVANLVKYFNAELVG